VQFDTLVDSSSWRVTLYLLLRTSSATWSKISQDITLNIFLCYFFCSLFDYIHSVWFDETLPNCMRFPLLLQKHHDRMLSNPNVSSETNPDIGRVPTARTWAQAFCKDVWLSCTCVGWKRYTEVFDHHLLWWSRPEVQVYYLLWHNNWECWNLHMLNSSPKTTKKAFHCPVYSMLWKERKMALDSDHCENGEIYCTVGDFSVLRKRQSPFTYEVQTKSWTETMLRTWGAQMNLVVSALDLDGGPGAQAWWEAPYAVAECSGGGMIDEATSISTYH